ncbi:MAG: hypothetical protein DWQ04_04900 [Chloroflexi bacterium]|nr:MAG: hypothetical protein DWQ04_04900 [Chloroflexota bacterium]
MFRTLLFISLLFGSAFGFTRFHEADYDVPYSIDENVQNQILAATVRITLFSYLTDSQGNLQYRMVNGNKITLYIVGEGLGTLTQLEEDAVIVTHDHWTLLTPNLHKVQFHNAANELLLEVSGEAFQDRILYRDGGTMVWRAPNELLLRRTPAGVGDGLMVQRNEVVFIALRKPHSDTLSIAAMRVEKQRFYKGQPVYRITGLNGESIVGGDSGGGVWVGGQLVGNIWTTTVEQKISRIEGEVVNSTTTPINSALAAQLPPFIESRIFQQP